MTTVASQMKNVAFEEINRNAPQLYELSKAIWNKPELCFNEHSAHDLLTTFLEKHKFQVERHFILPTAFRATYGEGPGPVVAMLCEYDALPDIGHACGHNLIAEVGVAAGLGIKAALETVHGFGKLLIIGTPAEEGGGGKILLLERGAFADVDVVLMAHPNTRNIVRPIHLCGQSVIVTFHGKASHASAFPWDGVNALDAAVMAYSSISVLRQQFKPKWRVHGVITNGGAKPNIIPEKTESFFIVRAPTRREFEELKKKFVNCMNAAAVATGCTVDLDWKGSPYFPVLTNRALAEAYEVNTGLVGKQLAPVEQTNESGGASTDFGNLSYAVPGLHPEFSISETASPHTRDFAFAAVDPSAQEITLLEAKCLAATALDVLTDAELLERIRETQAVDVATDSV